MDATMELSGVMMHRCRVCGKGFSCGRSLGGHMRSHILFGQEAGSGGGGGGDDEMRRCSNGVVGYGYGLRENPKKTRRLSEFADDGGEVEAEEEGGGDGELRACRVCGKLFSSWRSLFGHVRCRHAFAGGRSHDEEVGMKEDEEEADAEEEEEEIVAPAAVTVIAALPRRRRRSMRVAAPAPPPRFEKEQEDVALGLLMLSRDTGLWRSPSLAKEQPRPYGYNSDEDSALLHHGGGDVAVTKSRKRRRASYNYAPPNSSTSPKRWQQRAAAPAPAAKRTRYECPGCGKVFGSYQALGGHRASHKRINTSCSAPKAAGAGAAAEPSSTETYALLSTLSPDSVDAAGIGDDDRKANESSAAEEKFMFGGACSGDGELYAEMEMEQQSPAAAAGFLDLNYPPASSSEVA